MLKFCKYILGVLLVLISVCLFFDKIFENIYKNGDDLNRIKYITSQKGKHFDIVFLGSSRVVNTIVPDVFDKTLNLNTVNFGIMDAQPMDILTMAKLFESYNITYDTLFIQLDYYFNSLNKSRFLYYELLPYINENDVVDSYYKFEKNYFFLKFVPFYKFAINDAKLGVRAEVAALFKNSNAIIRKNKGFEPLNGSGNTWQRTLPKKIINNNKYIDSLERFKLSNHLNIKYFIAPFRSDTQRMGFVNDLKGELPNLIDFSSVILNDINFKNGYHLNQSGAIEFSELFANYIKNN
ncbi:hypothetical protein ACFFU1_13345 [Algibacter miyuki]|uniref:DUF1574 domain-containing protein n=1 Tax=Algibacter miyuki TaxID=1306933 RepID=A0ABV5H2B9_9FLAO|nr:hypothetical protein [Algibacter miyuki]MDN3666498.1 hypothetical protein [Algibacter miyuki]